jgi:hypothetical protein
VIVPTKLDPAFGRVIPYQLVLRWQVVSGSPCG